MNTRWKISVKPENSGATRNFSLFFGSFKKNLVVVKIYPLLSHQSPVGGRGAVLWLQGNPSSWLRGCPGGGGKAQKENQNFLLEFFRAPSFCFFEKSPE